MGGTQSKPILYAVPVSEPREGESAIYRDAQSKDKLVDCTKSGFITAQQIFQHHFEHSQNKEYLGHRQVLAYEQDAKTKKFVPKLADKYSWRTFSQVKDEITALGSGIERLGLAPVKSQYRNYNLKFIGIQGKNSVEWILSDIANICYGVTTMPLYDTLGEEAIDFMLHQTELTTLFLTTDLISQHVKRIKNPNPQFKTYLQNLVVMDESAIRDEHIKSLEGIKWFKFSDVIAEGRKVILPFPQVKPDDILCFSYTSGTTGLPKGAMVTHRNIMSTMGGCELRLDMITSEEVHLSYLPLAHVFERVVFLYISNLGAKYGIFGGDVFKLKDDLAILKPTFFPSVPRLFNKFHDTIKEKANELTGCKSSLYKKAERSKLDAVEHGEVKSTIYDMLIFNKMKQVLGGNVKFLLTASAPLSEPVKKFLKISFCCPFMEGYGQTEGCGGQFVTAPNDPRTDTVGGPLPMNEFKLIDVPEMKYFSTDKDEQGRLQPRGEILARGPNIIPGYYKNDEKNAEAFDSEGWLRSGDIGMIIPGTNSLKVIDRRKNIFKLSHGEYVAPEKLEQVYKTTRGIADIFVYGDSLKSSLVGIVNLDEPNALKVAHENGIQASSVKDLANNAQFNALLIKLFRATCDANQLKGFERIAKVYIDPVNFGDSNLVTTTFKLKRVETKEHYKNAIDEMYKGMD
jgi:long-chain acyl-CoA synthetase